MRKNDNRIRFLSYAMIGYLYRVKTLELDIPEFGINGSPSGDDAIRLFGIPAVTDFYNSDKFPKILRKVILSFDEYQHMDPDLRTKEVNSDISSILNYLSSTFPDFEGDISVKLLFDLK